jgi:diaminopropionate ammonia-lyase
VLGESLGPVSDAPRRLHRRLPGYRPTPLRDLPGLARELGVGRLLVKDESSRLGLPSFKALGASWALYRALEAHLGQSLEPFSDVAELAQRLAPHLPLRVVAATDGNHGRAVAAMARHLGLKCRIFVPRGTAAARIAAIEAEGAACEVVPGDYDAAVARSAAEAAGDRSGRTLVVSDTSWPGYEDVPRWVSEGYLTMLLEVDEQLTAAGLPGPDLVLVPMGVGALAAGVVRYYRRPGLADPPAIVGVEPVGADCVGQSLRAKERRTLASYRPSIMAGLNCETPSLVAWPLVAAGLNGAVAVEDEEAAAAMVDLARFGVVAGETGAAALAGLRVLLQGPGAEERRAALSLGPKATVLLLCTEGATDPEAYRRLVGRDPEDVAREGRVGAEGAGAEGAGAAGAGAAGAGAAGAGKDGAP